MPVEHLPYQIDPEGSRFHRYEQLWKETALALLLEETSTLQGWSHLDFGCGRGETMAMAGKLGMVSHGTDIDPQCLRLSSAYGGTTQLGRESPLELFGEKSFDLVTCFHVLEHLPRPKETLAALAKIARQRVLVAVPNLSGFHDLLRSKSRWDRAVNQGHLQSWDHAHFRNLAERHCGLRILTWGFDTVIVPPISQWVENVFGMRAAIALETRFFKRLYPYASLSVIALMQPVEGFVEPSTRV